MRIEFLQNSDLLCVVSALRLCAFVVKTVFCFPVSGLKLQVSK